MPKETSQRTAPHAALADDSPSPMAAARAARRASVSPLFVPCSANSTERISAKAIRGQLDRVLRSKAFQQVDRLKRFIDFIVREGAAGRGGDLKEYVIGVYAFDKNPQFDPRTDPIVRVHARRLRARLLRYYLEEGQHDEVVIELPKGGYAPTFRRRETATRHGVSLDTVAAGPNTIAVFPFADHSPGATLDRFCRGLRDEIVHALTSLRSLRVVTSNDDIAGTADRLTRTEAALIISGSVRDAGDHVRVTTQLLDSTRHYYLWSEATDAALADAVATQEAIARTVMARLEPEFGDGPTGATVAASTPRSNAPGAHASSTRISRRRT